QVEAIRQRVAEAAAAVQAQPCRVARADAGLDFILDGPMPGLPRYDVHDAAYGAVSVYNRGGSAQHLDALDRPGVERKGHTHAAILAQPVIQPHDRCAVREAARRKRRSAVARMAHGADGARAGNGLRHVGLAAFLDLAAVDDIDAGGRLAWRQVQVRSALGRPVELWGLVARPDDGGKR